MFNNKILSKGIAYLLLFITLLLIFLPNVNAQSYLDDLVYVYTFDDSDSNSTHTIDVINNNLATIGVGIDIGESCKFGECFKWRGLSTSSVTIADNPIVDVPVAGSYTINFWIKKNSTPSGFQQHLFRDEGEVCGYARMLIDGNTNTFLIINYANTGLGCSEYCYVRGSSTSFEDDNWHQITYVHNGTGLSCSGSIENVYVDGNKIFLTDVGSVGTPYEPRKFGVLLEGIGSGGTNPFVGLMDSYHRWTNRSLTQEEILYLYDNELIYPFIGITINYFKVDNLDNESISYKWEYTGLFEHLELYINSVLKLNTTNSSFLNYTANNLQPDTEYFGELFIYANATIFDYANITNTTDENIIPPQTSEESFKIIAEQTEEIKKSFNLFVFLFIFILSVFIPLIMKANYKELANTATIFSIMVLTILLFYIYIIPTNITTLLKWVISIIIIGTMFILNQEILLE